MFVIWRSPHGRASLMHEIDPEHHPDRRTLCGRAIYGGSRAYLHEPIPEVLCLRCTASRDRRDRENRP